MADSKITALTALTAADPANDMIPIVDVSDTPPASGNTKRISINNLLACSPSATLASATITGDLTVDTSTLKVDSSNNTVGIGNATPPTGASNTDIGLTLGAAGVVRSVLLGMQNCFGRIRERDATNNLAITTNIGATGTLDDNTRSSWKIRIGSGNDNYVLQRAAIGSSTFNDLLAIDSGGSCVWSDGAGGTRMTLNSTGLLIGTTNNFASSRLCVQGTAGTATPDVTIGIPVNASSNTNLAIGRSASTNGYIYLDAYKAGVGGTELVLNSINGGSVLIGLSTVVAAGGCLQLKSGITFPATQVASSDANTLDDYEEGTFTPTIVGSTSAGTGTYTTNTGKYTKIGNVVTLQVYINWTAHTGTGNMRIGNLPFTNGNAFWAGSFGFIANIALTAGHVLTGYVEAVSSYVILSQTPVGGGVASDVPIDTAGTIVFSASYTV